jgi:Cof subfamily protein (haloacid dehalogenase superfamily)
MDCRERAASAKKLIAVDLDGTLIGPNDAISSENIAAMQRAVQYGAAVVIATGRAYVSADAVARRVGLPPIPIMAFNGALIRWTNGGQVLTSCCLPADAAAEVVEAGRNQQLHMHYYLDDEMYVTQDNHWAQSYCKRAGMQCKRAGMQCSVIPDLRTFSGSEPIKLLVIDEPEKIVALLPECQARWKGRLYVTRSMPEYLEFLSPRVSKGLALDWLMEFFGLDSTDTLAIGDSMNDLPLLRAAGHAAAMPHSSPDVKSCAQFVPEDQSTGVAEAIDWFLERC